MLTTDNGAISLKRGDITHETADAIVNAANSGLLGGGGVDGAIHRAGGPSILEECKLIREDQGKCPSGSAVVTGAGSLKAKFVIHAVGPIWSGGNRNEGPTLAAAYSKCLNLATEYSLASICFPSISTGAYRFPIEEAAKIALETCVSFMRGKATTLQDVRFVLFSDDDLAVYASRLEELSSTIKSPA
ncbi:MAG: O-acetyl-ADP-ribose deacetylase [Bdellovibrionales bacterium]|nr:O-acetyl-ADP-ribose deacetylase [Bdellovibrionales bacterium]